jgi:hypothetical protein
MRTGTHGGSILAIGSVQNEVAHTSEAKDKGDADAAQQMNIGNRAAGNSIQYGAD